ncbi:60S ribosomal eL24 domain-containing protein [Aspergillus tanneri]|uniref:60S ribosomal protein L24 n=1 Tax=Aspergillus tanneri TaxID=1220188 RepID=A0A5M9M8Q6_9EURO|nr:60S ribosomal protein L24 [Aspergillus tanneri]KAA8643435.1 60S ribosomal protein L24 [Aspergillus tanneri]
MQTNEPEESIVDYNNNDNAGEEQRSPKENRFKRRFRIMTGGSPKSPGSADRCSWQSRSSTSHGESSLSIRSDSLTTHDTNTTGTSVGGSSNSSSPHKKSTGKRSVTAPAPLKLKYCSPTDLEFPETPRLIDKDKAADNNDGLLPRMKDAAEQASSNQQSAGAKASAKYHKTALRMRPQEGKALNEARRKCQDLIDYVRSVTDTVGETRNLSDSELKQKTHDARIKDAINLRCTNCRGDCPICGASCCIYDNARRTVIKEDSDTTKLEKAGRIVKMIDGMSQQAKEMNKFHLCSPPGGCGRYVCPKCCGVCHNEICRDIQCKLVRAAEVTWPLSEAPARQLCQPHYPLAAETDSTQPPNANRQHLVSPGCASPTFKMRTYDDSFSGQKIYPGKGKLYVRGDSKIFRFQNGKSESLFLQRKNPRRIAWTVLFRRQHRKGISEEVAKKRTRRVVKSQRAIVGASLDVIKERRNQRPEARAAARQQAIKEAKEKKAAAETKKKTEKAKLAASKGGAQRIQSKQGAKGAAPKVAAKSR